MQQHQQHQQQEEREQGLDYDRHWDLLSALRALRVSGEWEEAMDDESAVEMLAESIGRQAGFMSTAGVLWSELLLLSDAPSPPTPLPLPLPTEWPSFKRGLQTFLADHVGYGGESEREEEMEVPSGRTALVELLTSELQAARMITFAQPRSPARHPTAREGLDRHEAAQSLFNIEEALGLPRATHGVDALIHAHNKLSELLKGLPRDHLGSPLLTRLALSTPDMEKLERMNECFIEEYQVRREVLVKRLDVTLHALSCSTKRQEHESEVVDVVEVGKQALGKQATFGVYDILAARDDLARLYPAPDLAAHAMVKRLLIGSVPDRGGRVGEKRKDDAMPSMRERSAGLSSDGLGGPAAASGGPRGRSGGGGRAQRGGRVQGGWDEGAAGERRQRGGRGRRGGGGGKGGDQPKSAAAAAVGGEANTAASTAKPRGGGGGPRSGGNRRRGGAA